MRSRDRADARTPQIAAPPRSQDAPNRLFPLQGKSAFNFLNTFMPVYIIRNALAALVISFLP